MTFSNALKLRLKSGAILLTANMVLVQFAHAAEYTRTCPASLKMVMTSPFGSSRMDFSFKDRSIMPRVTMSGRSSGTSKNILGRKMAKKLSSHAATECINQWTSKAVKAFNSGKVGGKIIPPGVCKTPSEYVRFSSGTLTQDEVIRRKKKFVTTDASVNNLRWSYNTKDDKGFYDVLQTVCSSYGSGMKIQLSTVIQAGGSECKSKNGDIKWYTLDCNGITPVRLR